MASNGLVVTSVLVAVGAHEVALATSDTPSKAIAIKPVVAGFVLGVGLYGINAMNGTLGTQFCIFVMVASILVNGKKLSDGIGGIVK